MTSEQFQNRLSLFRAKYVSTFDADSGQKAGELNGYNRLNHTIFSYPYITSVAVAYWSQEALSHTMWKMHKSDHHDEMLPFFYW